MWNLLGDATPGPPGTYYYNNSEPKVYFWNMFDQVLIRPQLVDKFNGQTLAIVQSVGDISFLSESGTPNGDLASDHLPLIFEFIL
jgi:hypothetical protein